MMSRGIAIFLTVLTFMNTVQGQQGYRLPPKEVVDIIDAPPEPGVAFSPSGDWMLLVYRDAMPSIEDLARRMLRLGGIRIDPAANGRFQTDFIRGLALRPRDGGEVINLPFPDTVRIGTISWSHRSDAFVFTVITDQGTELWIAKTSDPSSPMRIVPSLTTVLDGFDWMPDGKQLLVNMVPENRGLEPTPPVAPAGPSIQESLGNTSPTRTFQDLLTNAYDEDLFVYYGTSQLALVDFDGNMTKVGKPGMIDSAIPSPDGNHILTVSINRPFSYTLAYDSFPKSIVVWDAKGAPLYTVTEVPMEENIPIEGVRLGPRGIGWRPRYPASLLWTEALDGGDPRNKVDHRERIIAISAPFISEPQELFKLQHRYAGFGFFTNPQLMLATEMDRDRRWVTTRLYDSSKPDIAPRVVFDRSIRDRYGDPGRIVTKPDETGYSVAVEDAGSVFLAGQGATPEGFRPFLDRKDKDTLETTRLWQCGEGSYEAAAMLLDMDGSGKPTIITRNESPTAPPNYFLIELSTEKRIQLTDFKDPTPQIRGIKKQIVKYQRADGVPLSATLYLPADYKPGTRLPLMVWAYPLEFNDPSTAGQIASSPFQFTRMASISHLTLLTQGYCIMDDATMPIVGDPETMNDTFVKQVVDSAKAAIDKAVEMGVADPERVAVGGHSYGAFMTANLMAHCDFFKAGVARSGAYNRTLTPFGFQSERRPLWEAKDIYAEISPFMHADKIKKPILLIHGKNDNNPGTFPLQSQRMYQAIKGNGGHVRLVMLPLESHGYRARESVLHTQAEMIEWLNQYVRDAK